MEILSPLTHKNKITKIKTISTEYISSVYKGGFDIETNSFFEGIENVDLYECDVTGYKFFAPFNVAGDGKFYEALQKYEWYYMPWKWEHQQTASLLKPGMNVLEVGCAEGAFLSKIKIDFKVNCVGLELNESACESAKSKGLEVNLETIQAYSENHIEEFDIVCSFQVLEHIDDVYSFIEAMTKTLKKGGKLIIGVPNDDSFYGKLESVLNMPPHHMGLWNEKSLSSLTNIFNLKDPDFYFEPLQDYHKEYYDKVIFDLKIQKMDENISKYGFIGRLKNQLLKYSYLKDIKKEFPTIESFTILSVLTKC